MGIFQDKGVYFRIKGHSSGLTRVFCNNGGYFVINEDVL